MKTQVIEASQVNNYEHLIDGLIQNEFGVVSEFLNADICQQLRDELLDHLANDRMHVAGIGNKIAHHKNAAVRGDVIKWIDNGTTIAAEVKFLAVIKEFIKYLNETCYTGINDFEFHYAYYDTGSFYKRHLDQFQSDKGRLYSFVTYLNLDWKEETGGQLVAYTPKQNLTVLPEAGTVTFFKSNIVEHEVLPATQPRLSIAGWLKKV